MLGDIVINTLNIKILNYVAFLPYFIMPVIHIHILFPQSLFPEGRFPRCGTEESRAAIFGEISDIGPYSLTACRAKPFTSEMHTAGCGLHRVIAFGFWGIQDCISSIINKSVLAG